MNYCWYKVPIGQIDVQSPRMRQYWVKYRLKELVGAFTISCQISKHSLPPTFIKDLGLFVQQLSLIYGSDCTLRVNVVIERRRWSRNWGYVRNAYEVTVDHRHLLLTSRSPHNDWCSSLFNDDSNGGDIYFQHQVAEQRPAINYDLLISAMYHHGSFIGKGPPFCHCHFCQRRQTENQRVQEANFGKKSPEYHQI